MNDVDHMIEFELALSLNEMEPCSAIKTPLAGDIIPRQFRNGTPLGMTSVPCREPADAVVTFGCNCRGTSRHLLCAPHLNFFTTEGACSGCLRPVDVLHVSRTSKWNTAV